MTVNTGEPVAERVTSQPHRALDVLFLTRGYYPRSRGGAENQAQLQAEALVRRGHRVTVVCPAGHGTPPESEHNGVRVVRLRVPALPGGLTRAAYTLRLMAWVAGHVRRFHLMHIHGLRFEANFAIPVARLLGRPVYLKLTSSGPSGEWESWQRGWRRPLLMARWALRLQTLTGAVADRLVADGVARERVVRIDNGIDLSRFRPATAEARLGARRASGLPEGQTIVLYCGTFQPLKGTPELLDAWHRLAPEAATLVLVGEAAAGYRLPSAPGIVVRPWQADVAAYYKAADVFVLPSRAEGMSNALLEALASGLAVVATRVGAAEALIGDCEQGLLVSPGDVEGLARALGKLVDDAPLRERFRTEAPGIVSALGIDEVVRRVEAAYVEMLGS